MPITITVTKTEARVLLNLIDIACKAAGLQAAEACLVLSKKVTEAVDEAAKKQPAE